MDDTENQLQALVFPNVRSFKKPADKKQVAPKKKTASKSVLAPTKKTVGTPEKKVKKKASAAALKKGDQVQNDSHVDAPSREFEEWAAKQRRYYEEVDSFPLSVEEIGVNVPEAEGRDEPAPSDFGHYEAEPLTTTESLVLEQDLPSVDAGIEVEVIASEPAAISPGETVPLAAAAVASEDVSPAVEPVPKKKVVGRKKKAAKKAEKAVVAETPVVQIDDSAPVTIASTTSSTKVSTSTTSSSSPSEPSVAGKRSGKTSPKQNNKSKKKQQQKKSQQEEVVDASSAPATSAAPSSTSVTASAPPSGGDVAGPVSVSIPARVSIAPEADRRESVLNISDFESLLRNADQSMRMSLATWDRQFPDGRKPSIAVYADEEEADLLEAFKTQNF